MRNRVTGGGIHSEHVLTMRLLIVGYGFYALGNGRSGGTVVAGALRWLIRRPGVKLEITFLARNRAAIRGIETKLKALTGRLDKYNLRHRLRFSIGTARDLSYENFDLAIVASPEHTHMSFLRAMAGKLEKVLFVKPFGQSLAEVEEALELSNSSGTEVFVELHKRYDSANQQFVNEARKNVGKANWFSFSYGQKATVPSVDFAKWAWRSNPFQYLAAHYLDIIFLILLSDGSNPENVEISGFAQSLPFEDNHEVRALVSATLVIGMDKHQSLVSANCNWMEPEAMPFPSRQRIEFQSEKAHLISNQDYRGQRFVSESGLLEPNPYFHREDDEEFAVGYGPDSIERFLNQLEFGSGAMSASLQSYLPTAKVLDFVNRSLRSNL